MAAQMTGDAWLLQELDELKRITTDTLPDGGVGLKPDATNQAYAKAELDGIALANPYFP